MKSKAETKSILKYKHVAQIILKYISSQNLVEGSRLPGGRTLMEICNAGKNTVYDALDYLNTHEFIEIREKSGAFVLKKAYEAVNGQAWNPYTNISWQKKDAKEIVSLDKQLFQDVDHSNSISSITLHSSFGYDKCVYEALQIFMRDYDNIVSLSTVNQLGSISLRKEIATFIKRSQGIDVKASNIIVTNGKENAIDLLIRGLLSQGGTLYTEDPNLLTNFTIASSIGVNIEGLQMDNEGILLDQINIHKNRRAVLLFSPFCHIPTGTVTSQKRREEILERCISLNIPIIETDIRRIYDNALKPLKAADKDGRVIYVGEIIMPITIGMNISWIILPDGLVQQFFALLKQTCPYSSGFNNKIVEIMLRYGIYERFLEQLNPKILHHQDVVDALLTKYLGAHGVWVKNNAIFWIKLNDDIDTEKLQRLNTKLLLLFGRIINKKFKQYLYIAPFSISHEKLEEYLVYLSSLIEMCKN